MQIQNQIRREWPLFVPPQSEPDVTDVPQMVELLWGLPYWIFEPLSGLRALYCEHTDGEFHAGPPAFSIRDGDNPWWNAAREASLPAVVDARYILQGRIVMPAQFWADSVYDLVTCRYLDLEEMTEWCQARAVPVTGLVSGGPEYELSWADLNRLATTHPHGLVVRPQCEMKMRESGQRVSFRAASYVFPYPGEEDE